MRVDEFMERMLKMIQVDEEELRSPLAKFIYDSDYREIGNLVRRKAELTKSQINTALAICRRSFTKDDIILFDILDEDGEGEEGIVFTETTIYHWHSNETVMEEVPYEIITDVDYDGDFVYLCTADGEAIDLYCGEDAGEEKYTRYMYNFISDILDFLAKEEKSGKRSASRETQEELPEETQEEVLLLPQTAGETNEEEVEE